MKSNKISKIQIYTPKKTIKQTAFFLKGPKNSPEKVIQSAKKETTNFPSLKPQNTPLEFSGDAKQNALTKISEISTPKISEEFTIDTVENSKVKETGGAFRNNKHLIPSKTSTHILLEKPKVSLSTSPIKQPPSMSELLRDKSLGYLLKNSNKGRNTSKKIETINTFDTFQQQYQFTMSSVRSNSGKSGNSDKSNISVNIFPINLTECINLEEKLQKILLKLCYYQSPLNDCIEWWNIYYNSSLNQNYTYLFNSFDNQKSIDINFHIEGLCYLLLMDCAKNKDTWKKSNNMLKGMFSLIHFDFILFTKFVLVKYNTIDENTSKLSKIINKELSANLKDKEINENLIIQLMKHNIKQILEFYKQILNALYSNEASKYANNFNWRKTESLLLFSLYSNNNSFTPTLGEHRKGFIASFFTDAFQHLFKYTYMDYDKFFKNFIVGKPPINIEIVDKSKNNTSFNNSNPKDPSKAIITLKGEQGTVHRLIGDENILPEISVEFKYTLVLELEEVLVFCIFDKKLENTGKAKLIFRPKVFEFLRKMKKLYELILYSKNTSDFLLPILSALEKKENFFEYKLYRNYCFNVDGNYVKDLSKLGRDLSKTVIVDTFEENFMYQKDNGICIKSFFGDRVEDNYALVKLSDILEKIRFDGDNDVRESIKKYYSKGKKIE